MYSFIYGFHTSGKTFELFMVIFYNSNVIKKIKPQILFLDIKNMTVKHPHQEKLLLNAFKLCNILKEQILHFITIICALNLRFYEIGLFSRHCIFTVYIFKFCGC